MKHVACAIGFIALLVATISCRKREGVRDTAPASQPAEHHATADASQHIPEDEQTFPISDNEPVPDFSVVARAMIAPGSHLTVEEVTQQIKMDIARSYVDGGERYYSTETGHIITDLPDALKRLPKSTAVPLYAALWLRDHTPTRIKCAQHNFPLVKSHKLFTALAKGCLFKTMTAEDEDRLARSIVQNFCLGGEFQVNHLTAPENWRREKRIGSKNYKTVTEYVTLLAEERNNALYCETIKKLDSVLASPVSKRQ